jgi:hypothetical protein
MKKQKPKVTKKYGIDFKSKYDSALTLDTSVIGQHENGWTVSGEIQEDYFVWVSDFEAEHPTWGKVWGNFEDEVYATSERAFKKFYKEFPPVSWDYGDI